MPVYVYKHSGKHGPECPEVFEITQGMRDDRLETCPICGETVERLICPVGIATPATNSHLKNLGFTKLVKRDDGVYENVTAGDQEKKYMVRGDESSVPSFKDKVSD